MYAFKYTRSVINWQELLSETYFFLSAAVEVRSLHVVIMDMNAMAPNWLFFCGMVVQHTSLTENRSKNLVHKV